MKAPTGRQTEALAFIRERRAGTGSYPTLTDISKAFGFSRNAAWELVSSMEKKGLIEKDSSGGIVLPEEERIGMENIRAELWDRTGLLGETWVPRTLAKYGELFAFRISTDEMKNAGILPGDEAVFVRGSAVKNGDIVLSRTGDGETLFLRRYLLRPDGFTDLVPENDTIGKTTTKDPEILGRMIRLIRRY